MRTDNNDGLVRRGFSVLGLAATAGAPRGLCTTLKNEVSADLLAFLRT